MTATEALSALLPTRVDTLRVEDGEFFSPTTTSVALTTTGNSVALDRDDEQLVLFDSTGRLLKRVGGKGDGPGEFRSPSAIFVLPRDSIAIWDTQLLRLSFFDASLKFDRTERLSRVRLDGGTAPVGRLSDGRWVALVVTNGPFKYGETGARRVIDTATLWVGRSDEAPVEFQRLRHHDGVDFSAKSTRWSFRLGGLIVGVGAICERGAVLVDSGGVRLVDSAGRMVQRYSLPRSGDTISTAAERARIIDDQVPETPEFNEARAQSRRLIEEIVSGIKVRMRHPILDGNGRLWYNRNKLPSKPPFTYDRVDSAGRSLVAVTLPPIFGSAPIKGNAIARIQFGTDTSGVTVAVSRFSARIEGDVDRRLGRCFASFDY